MCIMFFHTPLLLSLLWASPVIGSDFFITSAEGFASYFENPETGERYGMRFQNAVYTDREKGERIGTNQGYSMWFPDDPWMMASPAYGNNTGTSLDALFKVPTRTFFLESGTITCVNEAIVGATGSYVKYFGGMLLEEATGTDPYEAEITLVLPSSSGAGDESTSSGSFNNVARNRHALVMIAFIVSSATSLL